MCVSYAKCYKSKRSEFIWQRKSRYFTKASTISYMYDRCIHVVKSIKWHWCPNAQSIVDHQVRSPNRLIFMMTWINSHEQFRDTHVINRSG